MELIPHPGHPPRRLTAITARAERTGQCLSLTFVLRGDVAGLRIAPGAGRTDGLWQASACEAFVTAKGPGYRELNFAPGGGWAAYAFDAYRAGMRDDPAVPRTTWDGTRLDAAITLDLVGDWRVNLTAAIMEADGTRSFWALAHPAGSPDFHDRDCFVLELPATR